MKLHAALALSLRNHGVDTIFGLAGDGNLFFVDSYAREAGTYVAAANEAGAIVMGIGYAEASGRLGVVTVTHGPGLTNTLTGLIEGVRGRTPVLLISGDTEAAYRDHPQEIAQSELVVATGAGFEQVRAPETALEDLAIAIRRALVERRPVVFNVPAEFMWVEIPYVATTRPVAQAGPIVPLEADVEAAVGIIANARRPIVLAGRGAAEARDAILGFADRIGAPVATSVGGKGLFRGAPLDLGIMGTMADLVAVDVMGQADCLISFGAGLNPYTTGRGALLAGKRVVQVDIEASRIGKYQGPDAHIVGDANQVASTLVKWLDEAEISPTNFGSAAIARARARATQVEDRAHGSPGTIDVALALREIDRTVKEDRIFVSDAGRFISVSWTTVHVQTPKSFVMTHNFGAIGLGMSAAVGAAYGAPDRTVLMVCGDGGFMLGGLSEFNTAVRCGLDVIVVVCNDFAYGAEHIQLIDRGISPEVTEFQWPDFAQVAESLGGHGVTVRNADDLELALNAIGTRDLPLLIDVRVDPHRMPDLTH